MGISGAVCDPGTSFLITFPQSMVNKDSNSYLHVFPTGGQQVSVNVTTLPSAPSVVDQSFTVLAGNKVKLSVEDGAQVATSVILL